MYNMSSVNSDSLPSSLPIWMPFVSLCFLIDMAMTSSAMLSRGGESGHPCLVPYPRGKIFSFSVFSMMLAVGLSYTALIMLWLLLCIPIF